jgi:hypothetical protein
MKECIKLWKKYRNDPTNDNFVIFFDAAISEYIKIKTGKHLHIHDVGIKNLKDMDRWIYNDWKFKEWFKKEFNYWIKYEGTDLVLIDLMWIGAKKSMFGPEIKSNVPIVEAKPRDVDDLKPEV